MATAIAVVFRVIAHDDAAAKNQLASSESLFQLLVHDWHTSKNSSKLARAALRTL
jgi:hypothetical protein